LVRMTLKLMVKMIMMIRFEVLIAVMFEIMFLHGMPCSFIDTFLQLLVSTILHGANT
jgi:hypothetical protein